MNSRLGQSMIEYILVFVAVVVVLLVAVGPGGILSDKIDESLNEAIEGAKRMTIDTCCDLNRNPLECPNVCP